MTVFRAATLRTFFFAIFAGAKELKKDGSVYEVGYLQLRINRQPVP